MVSNHTVPRENSRLSNIFYSYTRAVHHPMQCSPKSTMHLIGVLKADCVQRTTYAVKDGIIFMIILWEGSCLRCASRFESNFCILRSSLPIDDPRLKARGGRE